MKHVVVNVDQITRAEIRDVIGRLREKRAKACIQSTRDELDADCDELLDLWPSAPETA